MDFSTLTANWKTRTSKTLTSNSEILSEVDTVSAENFNSQQRKPTVNNNSEAFENSVELTSSVAENLTNEPEVSAAQDASPSDNNSSTIGVKSSLTFDKLCSELQPVAQVTQSSTAVPFRLHIGEKASSDAKKPRRTISHYLSQKKNLVHPIVTSSSVAEVFTDSVSARSSLEEKECTGGTVIRFSEENNAVSSNNQSQICSIHIHDISASNCLEQSPVTVGRFECNTNFPSVTKHSEIQGNKFAAGKDVSCNALLASNSSRVHSIVHIEQNALTCVPQLSASPVGKQLPENSVKLVPLTDNRTSQGNQVITAVKEVEEMNFCSSEIDSMQLLLETKYHKETPVGTLDNYPVCKKCFAISNKCIKENKRWKSADDLLLLVNTEFTDRSHQLDKAENHLNICRSQQMQQMLTKGVSSDGEDGKSDGIIIVENDAVSEHSCSSKLRKSLKEATRDLLTSDVAIHEKLIIQSESLNKVGNELHASLDSGHVLGCLMSNFADSTNPSRVTDALNDKQPILIQVQLVNSVQSCLAVDNAPLLVTSENKNNSENISVCNSSYLPVSDAVSMSKEIIMKDNCSNTASMMNSCNMGSSINREVLLKPSSHECNCVYVLCDNNRKCLPATNSVLNLPTNSPLAGGLRYGFTNAFVNNRLTTVQPFGPVNSFQPFAVYMPCIPVVSQPTYSVMLLNPLPSNSTVQTAEASSSQQLDRSNKTLMTHAPNLIQNCHGIYAAAMAQQSHSSSLAASSAASLYQNNSCVVLVGSDKTLLPSTLVPSVNDCSNSSDICLFSSEPIHLSSGSGNTGHDTVQNSETAFTTSSKFSVSSCSESDDASKRALAITSASVAGNIGFETVVDNFDSHTVNKPCALESSDERIDLQNETVIGLSGLNAVVSNDVMKGSTMGFVEGCTETYAINESVVQNIGTALSSNDHCARNDSVSENQGNVVGSFSENSCQSHPYQNGISENDKMEENCVSLPQKIPLSSSNGNHATESYSFIAIDSTKQLNWQSSAVDDGKSSHMFALKSTEWDSAILESERTDSAIAPELSNKGCRLQSREISQATDPVVHSSGVENDSQMPGLLCLETRATNLNDNFLKEPSCSALVAKYFVSRHSETSGLFDNITSVSDFGRKLSQSRLEYQEICHHSKGQADMMSPFETNKLIHPPLSTQEHWSDRSCLTFLPRTYNNADTEPSNKSIMTLDIVRGSNSQNRSSNVLCDNIQPSKGNKRSSKTSKIHKKRCTTKVGLDMEINNDVLGNRETDEVFSHNISNFKEYNLQNYVAPPISHFLPKSSRTIALLDAEKAVEFKETYQPMHSEVDKNKLLLLATDQMTDDNTKTAEKQVMESFNEDSSNVLPELNFPDNEDFPCISLDDMVRMIDPNPVHGRTSSQSRSTVGHWHQELYDSSKKGKLRDKHDHSRHRHDDEIDRYAEQSRQDLFNISADGYSEQDDLHSTAVDDFNSTMQNQKTNASTFSSWQLPAFSNSLSDPSKCTYHSASNKMCSSDNSSSNYAQSGHYSSSERLNFVSRALTPVSMANSRSKNLSSSGIFCLAQHAVPEKSSSSNNFMPGYCHDFSCVKEVPSTCSMNSHSANREQSFSDRGRNFPSYNFPSYGNDYAVEKSCRTVSNSADNCLWSSYGSKQKGKRGLVSSSSHSVVPTAPVLSFRPQVEVEYSNAKPRTKDTFVHVTSSFLSHIATEKDSRHSTTLAASVPAVDNLAYGSWNDRMKDPGFLSAHGDPWRGSYCSSSAWKLGANDTTYCQSSRAEISAVSSVGSADLAASSSEQFHFSISGSGLTSTASSLPPFSLSCLPMDHGSFAFNLSSVTDMPSAENGINSSSCSQERRNLFLVYPLEHNEEDLHNDHSLNRPPLSLNSSSQGITTNFSFEFCDMPEKTYKSRLTGTEDLHQKRKSELSPNNQAKPLPSFLNIASYGLKDKMPVSSCSETFYPKEFDSLNLSHGCASSVAYSMPFSHTSYAGSCSLNSYPQNFYHHSTFPVSLTSPPLHHHPPLADRCLNSEQQPRFDSSFPLRNLQFPPVLNFVHHPLPPPPTFDAPSMVPFQSQIVENLPTATDHEKLDFRMFHMNENRNSKSGIAYNDQSDIHTAITGETHSLKLISKRSSRNAKKKHATLQSGNILEASQNMTPYFPIPNFSPSKNCNQDIPAYISNNPFRGETGSAQASFNHTGYQSSSSFNPLLPVSQGSLNLHQSVTGFAISTASSIMPNTSSASVLPPIHNFGFPNFFSDLSNPTVFGGEGLNISPVKLHKGVPSFLSTSTTMNSLHHQPVSKMSTVFSNRSPCSPPPSTLHNLSINSLLSNQHQRFDETRAVVSSTAVGFVTGEIKSSTFGLYRP